MVLRDWLAAKQRQPGDFAAEVGMPVRTLYRYINHERIPRGAAMERIVAATSGEVQPGDFYKPLGAVSEAAA